MINHKPEAKLRRVAAAISGWTGWLSLNKGAAKLIETMPINKVRMPFGFSWEWLEGVEKFILNTFLFNSE